MEIKTLILSLFLRKNKTIKTVRRLSPTFFGEDKKTEVLSSLFSSKGFQQMTISSMRFQQSQRKKNIVSRISLSQGPMAMEERLCFVCLKQNKKWRNPLR